MAQLYDRAEIYDLIDSEERRQIIREHWRLLLEERPVRTLLDVSIGTGNLTLPAQELARRLTEVGIRTKIIEANAERCDLLNDEIPKAIVINGDGTERESGIPETSRISLLNIARLSRPFKKTGLLLKSNARNSGKRPPTGEHGGRQGR